MVGGLIFRTTGTSMSDVYGPAVHVCRIANDLCYQDLAHMVLRCWSHRWTVTRLVDTSLAMPVDIYQGRTRVAITQKFYMIN